MSPDLTIVVFTRDDADHLRRCLAVLATQPPEAAFEVVVFDNASRDDTPDVVADAALQLDECRLIRVEEETSFSIGNNRGLREARGPFVLFLNPDTEPEGTVLDAALDIARSTPEVGLLSPRLHYSNGDAQPTGWHLPTPLGLARERLGLRERHVAPAGEVTDVGWLMGCFLLGPRRFLRDLGGFDEAFWFHGTDLELCGRVKRAGRRVVRLETASLLHVGHRTWNDMRRDRTRAATLQYLRREHGAAVGGVGKLVSAVERLAR